MLCLLASTTRTHNHPSGPQPLKTAGWLDPDVLLEAALQDYDVITDEAIAEYSLAQAKASFPSPINSTTGESNAHHHH